MFEKFKKNRCQKKIDAKNDESFPVNQSLSRNSNDLRFTVQHKIDKIHETLHTFDMKSLQRHQRQNKYSK